ncbi:MAG: short-chain dehydrogenase/reductase [Cypionkella sp.]|uniref:SDR family NAD(P)-dependent oxidoreductase n=1 Tax=Cypionkella sp. TaxID=2811411 RepID=UPI00260D2CBB|nr:SDR family oxidoreductase [Cypionkella sp.]MDB5661249.1 short-chain dehydrogenase/reductase [Cypionkella sp.]
MTALPNATPSRPVALITGASSGIGAVYADRLAARGYDLILVARRGDRLAALAEDLKAHGASARIQIADLTTEAGLSAVESLLADDPSIALLVNNAGLARIGGFGAMSAGDIAAQLSLNIVAPTRLTHAVLPGFLARGAGAIINIASAVALHTYPGTTVYSGTKAYMLAFSRGIAEEVAGSGIRVQAVLPAAVGTEIYDLSGFDIASVPSEFVMTTQNLVDAALSGFDAGESVTLPSVEDATLWDSFEAARLPLFAASQSGTPASRYHSG